MGEKIRIGSFETEERRIIRNPSDQFFVDFLKNYYVITADKQYLFGSLQPGRRPDRAFYMVPDGYKLGKGQKYFDVDIGKKIYDLAFEYLKNAKIILQDVVQGEDSWKTDLQIVVSIENPHSAYIAWMGKQMVFPKGKTRNPECFNFIIPEPLPKEIQNKIKEVWVDYDPSEPLTLYDFTKMESDIRMVLNLGVDYFGGAYKKPNLTMVWNRAEAEGHVSYHAGSTSDRILKGLSGTGKTTLSVGPLLEQDDANIGKIHREERKIKEIELVGLEAASFAKSEGLSPESPEWAGLIKSKEIGKDGKNPIVLCMNIDCEGVEYEIKEINNYRCKIPVAKKGVGRLQCQSYEKSGTTNGRFIFKFSELNPSWGKRNKKLLRAEGLCFKRFDISDPALRVYNPEMAVALDSACESVITSAVSGKKPGTRTRSYAATDFMAREQSQQALLKLQIYRDLSLRPGGQLIFFILNTGYVGEYDIMGNQRMRRDKDGNPIPKLKNGTPIKGPDGKPVFGRGEKIQVQDTKKLLDIIEKDKIKNWLKHPIFDYMIPDPGELEKDHGMKNFGRRFNPLNYYTPDEIIAFAKRDINERTDFLEELFKGQAHEKELKEVVSCWKKTKIPTADKLEGFYNDYFG
jgi:hypothetical protein